MIIKCSSCASRYKVSDDLVADGPKKFKCKNCGAVLLVKPPAAAGENPPAKAAAPSPAPAPKKPPVPPEVDEQSDDIAASAEDNREAAEENAGNAPAFSNLSPEELAAQQQQDIQEKLEKRRQQMEDEISGRLNKAALETLDFEVLSELANKIQDIHNNPDFRMDPETRLFSCIKCKTTYCIYPDDARICANCSGDVSLVRADDILKQYGMFG